MKIVLANVSKFPVGWYNLDFKWHINVTLINNESTYIFYNLAENIFYGFINGKDKTSCILD